MNEVTEMLAALTDESYRDFHAKLIPTVPKERILGVRIPRIRALAKEISGTPAADSFLTILPHDYYDENNLHAFLIERVKDFDTALELTEAFLPYIDNWATCDSFIPPVYKKKAELLLPHLERWIQSDRVYTVRYAIGLYMGLFLDERFDDKYPALVAAVRSDEYYVNMMRAWYFATALDKQYNSVIGYFTENRLDVWTHNKAIQKARESYRIPVDTKEYLKSLKRV